MKKLINDPTTVVADALHGIEAAHPDLRVDHEHKILYRADAPVLGKVGLISGRIRHEPLHGGFVGCGMLDGTPVRCSPRLPRPDARGHQARRRWRGVVHIVKNYTGDVMNSRWPPRWPRLAGVKVESIVTNDDVAVRDSLWRRAVEASG